MLAIKPANASNRRVQRFTGAHRQFNSVLVKHRQHARQTKVNLVRFTIRLSIASVIISRAKQFGFGRQLDVALDTNGHFILIIYTHHNAPKSFSACSKLVMARRKLCTVSFTLVSWAI